MLESRHIVLIVVVVGVVVGLLLVSLSRVKFSGCHIYREGAAEISVDKYKPKIEMLTLMNSNW